MSTLAVALSRFEPGDVRVCSGNFGRYETAAPAAVVRPRSASEIAEVLALARAHGVRVVARGAGHGTGAQNLAPGGVVMDMTSLGRVRGVEGDAVWAEAGATWRAVVAATLPRGLIVPALTDYLGLTVGGTLSAGGIGGETFRTGAQVDNVLELEVVTGEGKVVRCGPGDAVFDGARAGFGRAGIIVAARMRLVAAPAKVVVEAQEGALPDLVAGVFGVQADHIHIRSTPRARGGWTHELLAARYDGPGRGAPYGKFILRVDAYARRHARAPLAHPFLDVFLPLAAAPGFIARSLPDCEGADLLTYPVRRSLCHAPGLRLPDAEEIVLFDVLGSVPAEAAARVIAGYRRLHADAQAVGGTLYPIGSV